MEGGGEAREDEPKSTVIGLMGGLNSARPLRLRSIYMFGPPITILEVVLVYKYSNDIRSKILSYNIENCTCYSRNMPKWCN